MAEKSVRQQAIDAILEGGSVRIGGVSYTANGGERSKPLSELPNELEFAKLFGDKKAEEDAVANLKAEVAKLTAQLAKAESAKKVEASKEPKKE